jgi:hypothetical protein
VSQFGRNRLFRTLLIARSFDRIESASHNTSCANGGTTNSKTMGSIEPNAYAKPFVIAREPRVRHHLIGSELPQMVARTMLSLPTKHSRKPDEFSLREASDLRALRTNSTITNSTIVSSPRFDASFIREASLKDADSSDRER